MSNINTTRPKPVILIILDGWGVAPPSRSNAISMSKTPNMDKYITAYPAMTLQAAGEGVGLIWGEMGNSEVGHMNLGAGRIIYQDYPRITKSIVDGDFFTNEKFLKAVSRVKENTRAKLHLIALLSVGGIHGHYEHLLAMLELAARSNLKPEQVCVHAILDGRDSLFNAGLDLINKVRQKIQTLGVGRIATISGRYFAMDRNNYWSRTQKAYMAIAEGQSDYVFEDPEEAVKESYKQKIYDEEFVPTVIKDKNGNSSVKISNEDAVIFMNFRADRARQLTEAFILPGFEKFQRPKFYQDLLFVTMTEYDKNYSAEPAYPPIVIDLHLSKIISRAGLKQLHIAETEKYAHVTYFFSGGKEEKLEGEDRILIPSPQVPVYDQEPKMSAPQITLRVLEEIQSGKYDFIVLNFANADMVGHTGNLKATMEAIEYLDKCIGNVVDAILDKKAVAVITADHGKAEEMLNLQTGIINKEHTVNPVPFILIGSQWEGQTAGLSGALSSDLSLAPPSGMLSDVAPTILRIMGLQKPEEMLGRALI